MKTEICGKWYCQTPLERTVKRTLVQAGTRVTVVNVRCPKCGWQHEDYDVEAVVAVKRDAAQHERSRRLKRAMKRYQVVKS